MMYLLTKNPDSLESGAYASLDEDNNVIVQFFVKEDDAVTFATMLEAIGEDLHITEIGEEIFEKFCQASGHAYTVADEGEIVIPKIETLTHTLIN